MPPARKNAPATEKHLAFKQGQVLVAAALLTVLTVVLFWPLGGHEFINYDDPDYVSANPIVQGGMTWEGAKWAFTSSHSFNWHPVTWISHMIDVELFGLNAGKHHLVNVGFHVANTLLLFLLVLLSVRSSVIGFFVAAVFAWHPLHVESVAWACERKDVLSTFFWLLTTLCYIGFVRSRLIRNNHHKMFYGAALASFAVGLMAKPMLVTLPFTLLLLDWWPLKRFETDGSVWKSLRPLVLEKVPFFLLAVASCVVTYLVQQSEGAVVRFEHLPLGDRLSNAAVAYLRYLAKTIYPTELIVYYQPQSWSAWAVALCSVAVVGISCVVFLRARKEPAIFFGWFWFVGTLVPVIGIIQVGAQAIADRYMYVPMIGLSVAACAGWSHLLCKRRNGSVFGILVAVVFCGSMFVLSAKQLKIWRDSVTLFTHVTTVDPTNVVGGVMLANALLEKGQLAEAEKRFQSVLALNPNFPEVHFNLGNLSVQQQQPSKAIAHYSAALSINSNYVDAHANLAVAYGMQNRFEEAIAHYHRALQIQPNQPELLRNLALDLTTLRRFDEAAESLQKAMKLNPSDATALFFLGNVYLAQGRNSDAIECYARTLQLQPDHAGAKERLGSLR